MNRVMLTGRLTRDPELRSLANGRTVTQFAIATHDYRGGTEKAEYHNVVTWDRLAEICSQYLGKGQLVAVEGRIQTRQWEDDKKIRQCQVNPRAFASALPVRADLWRQESSVHILGQPVPLSPPRSRESGGEQRGRYPTSEHRPPVPADIELGADGRSGMVCNGFFAIISVVDPVTRSRDAGRVQTHMAQLMDPHHGLLGRGQVVQHQ